MYRKFHNRKTIVDGIKFDSMLEAQRYNELRLMQRTGLIKDLILQPEYELQPSFKKNGKTYRRIVYKADFSYVRVKDGKIIVEDTKGSEKIITEVFKLKQKLFEYKYPNLTIKIIFPR